MGGGVPTPGGTLRSLDQRGVHPAFPMPNLPGKSAHLSGWVLCPQRPPLGCVGPGGIRGRLAENRRGRWEESSRTGGVGEEQRVFASPTRAQETCWAPRWGTLSSDTRVTRNAWVPSVLLSLSCTLHTPQGFFQPCES